MGRDDHLRRMLSLVDSHLLIAYSFTFFLSILLLFKIFFLLFGSHNPFYCLSYDLC